MLRVFRGEPVAGRRPRLRDQLQAAAWLADRGWGTAVQVVEVRLAPGEAPAASAEDPAGPTAPPATPALRVLPGRLHTGHPAAGVGVTPGRPTPRLTADPGGRRPAAATGPRPAPPRPHPDE